jgi:hypothetical protein
MVDCSTRALDRLLNVVIWSHESHTDMSFTGQKRSGMSDPWAYEGFDASTTSTAK